MFRFLKTIIFGIFKWVRPTLEGDDGKASARRITAYLITFLYASGHSYVFLKTTDGELLFKVLFLDMMFILLLFGILTIQNLIMLWKLNNNQPIDVTSTTLTDTSSKSTTTTSISTPAPVTPIVLDEQELPKPSN